MTFTLPCTLALLLCATAPLRAQGFGFPNRFSTAPQTGALRRPPVSPYINLLRNNPPVLNYYGIVRPELDAIDAQMQFESRLDAMSEQIRQRGLEAPTRLGTSGHAAQFMTDMSGQPASLAIQSAERQTRRRDKQRRLGHAMPATGHSAYFDNGGNFYSTLLRRQQ